MSLPNSASSHPTAPFADAPFTGPTNGKPSSDRSQRDQTGDDQFVDRRQQGGQQGRSERRQFGSSHDSLTEAGRELALAIDQYKLQHHRRYITCDEMLHVITQLGYRK